LHLNHEDQLIRCSSREEFARQPHGGPLRFA
jgi:hypothetical protein